MSFIYNILFPPNAFDSFNRPTNFTTLGNTDTGQVWTAGVGTWGINSNNYAYVQNGAGENVAVIDYQYSNVLVQTKVINNANYSRVVCRYTDSNNYIMVQTSATGYSVHKRVAGTFTQIGSYAQVPVANDIMTLIAIGSVIYFSLNNNVVLSISETFNQTATKHGLGAGFASGTANQRFDYFRVEAL